MIVAKDCQFYEGTPMIPAYFQKKYDKLEKNKRKNFEMKKRKRQKAEKHNKEMILSRSREYYIKSKLAVLRSDQVLRS